MATALAPATSIPAQLDVDAALVARKEEIVALHRAITQARASTNTRAWQLLPRHLRRRAASHNLLRLPSRLRGKARAELRSSHTEPKTRSAMRRRMAERTLLGFVRRRCSLERRAGRPHRRWLETHLWHAKRFRMSVDKTLPHGGPGSFGFSLAESPHQKSRRPSTRFLPHTMMLHDASYHAVLRLRATSKGDAVQATKRLQLLLHLAGAAHGWEDKWTAGTHLCDTTLLQRPRGPQSNKATEWCLAPLAPIQVVWVPPHGTRRECHVWVHPAGAADLFRMVQEALDCVRTVSAKRPPPCAIAQDWRVDVALSHTLLDQASPVVAAGTWHARRGRPLRSVHASDNDGYNRFDLSGDEALRVLGGVLKPVTPTTRKETARQAFFEKWVHAPEPTDALSSHRLLSLTVHDPRLHFPPKKAAPFKNSVVHPDDNLALADDTFFAYHKLPTYTKGAMDQRRARQPVPGQPLAPTAQDDRIPVVLVPTPRAPSQAWACTLLVPRGWGLPFWHALVYSGARVLGQDQVRQRQLHAGLPSFPYDWVSTAAYRAAEDGAAAQRKAAYARRPPAKRVNYAKGSSVSAHPFGGMEAWSALLDGLPVGTPVLSPAAWRQLCSASNRTERTQTRWTYASLWTRRAYQEGLLTKSALRPALPDPTVVMVLLVACRRGAFHVLDSVHSPATDAEAAQWRAALDPPTREKERGRTVLAGLERQPPPERVGAVTTGDYSLVNGHGRAIASMRLDAWLALEQRETRVHLEKRWGRPKRNPVPLAHLVLVRNAQGGVVHAASAQLVST